MRKKKKVGTGLNTSKNNLGVPPLLLNTSSASSLVPPLFGHNSLSVKNANSGSFAGLEDPAHQSFQVSLGIDFTFNTIKNVKKVAWK